jgi:hypothetical protein
VEGLVLVPGGALLTIHAGNTPPQMKIGRIPGLLARRLKEAGIADATVSRAATMGWRYEILSTFTPVARALIRGPHDRRDAQARPGLITELAGIAAEWLRRELRPGMELTALVLAVEIPITLDTLPQVAAGIVRQDHGRITVVASDFRTQVAAAVFGEFSGLGLKLTAAGLDWPATEITRHMHTARDIIRAHAQNSPWSLHSAAVTAQPADHYLLYPRWLERDNVSFLPAWYQILPLTGEQMAGVASHPGRLRPGFTNVAAPRIDLTVGDPEQWIPGHPDREDVRAQARRELTAGAEL